MGLGSFFKKFLGIERTVAGIASAAGVTVPIKGKNIPIGQLQETGEKIGSEVAGVVTDTKSVVKQFKTPSGPQA